MSDNLEEIWWTEPGRSVDDKGKIIYAWPPQGRFIEIWERFCETFPDDTERSEVMSLFRHWQHSTSTLVSYTNDAGEWVDVDIPDFPPEEDNPI